MTEPSAPGVGEAFGGYTIESSLGRGGMGAVYLATHARLARKVALKVIAPELAHDDEFRARFLRETQLAASLEHANVIPIYDAGEVDGVLYLAMRYVAGPSLRTLLRERGALSAGETLRSRGRSAARSTRRTRRASSTGTSSRRTCSSRSRESRRSSATSASPSGATTQGLTRTGSFLGTADYARPSRSRGGRSTAAPTSTRSAASSSTASRVARRTCATPSTPSSMRTSPTRRRRSRA